MQYFFHLVIRKIIGESAKYTTCLTDGYKFFQRKNPRKVWGFTHTLTLNKSFVIMWSGRSGLAPNALCPYYSTKSQG